MKVERHGYRFTNKHNTRGGVISTVIAIIAFAALVVGIVISYRAKGNAGLIVGAAGAMAFLVSTAGLITGLKSFKERDKFYIFSWVGTVSNGIIWIAMCGIIAMGIMA